MDKAEYQVRLGHIKELVDDQDYEGALKIVQTIEWKRVKSVNTLCMVADIYEANGMLEDCKRILRLAYNRSSIGKTILSRLVELALKLDKLDEAAEYYNRFVKAAPNDATRYLLKYKIYKAQQAPVEDLIDALRSYKDREYTERWAYELARLYSKAGMVDECVEECDDIILWFSEGVYVIRAMELKMKYTPLTPSQQEKYNNRYETTPELYEQAAAQPMPAAGGLPQPAVFGAPQSAAASQSVDPASAAPRQEEAFTSTVDLQERLSESLMKVIGGFVHNGNGPMGQEIHMDVEPETLEEIQEYHDVRDLEPEQLVSSSGVRREAVVTRPDSREDAAGADIDFSAILEAQADMLTGADEMADGMDEAAAAREQVETVKETPAENINHEEVPDGEEPADVLGKTIDISAAIRSETGQGETAVEPERDAVEEPAPVEEETVSAAVEPESVEAAVSESGDTAAEEGAAEGSVETVPSAGKGAVPAAPKPAESAAAAVPVPKTVAAPEMTESSVSVEESPREASAAPQESPAVSETVDAAEPSEAPQESPAVPEMSGAAKPSEAPQEDPVAPETVEPAKSAVAPLKEEPIISGSAEPAVSQEEKPVVPVPEQEPKRRKETDTIPESAVRKWEWPRVDAPSVKTEAQKPAPEPAKPAVPGSVSGSSGPAAPKPAAEIPEAAVQKPVPETPGPAAASVPDELDLEALLASEIEQMVEGVKKPEPKEEPEKDLIARLEEEAERTIVHEEMVKETPQDKRYRIIHADRPNRLTEEQKRLFTYFAKIPGMDEQILEAIHTTYNEAVNKTSRHGNIAIMGRPGTGKTRLSEGLVRSLCKEFEMPAAKIARIHAEKLNEKDVAKVVGKMAGGFLIVEQAGKMSPETIHSLSQSMEFRTDSMILLIEDDKKDMRQLLADYPEFAEKFDSVISIPVFTNDELVTFARTYAGERGYKMDEMGVLALYTIIGDNQKEDEPVSVAQVKEMVDFAIRKASRGGRRFGRKLSGRQTDENNRIILYEKDFNIK